MAGFTRAANAQQGEWPRVINSTNGSIIKVYEPQPESFSGNILKSRAAVSYQKDASSEPVFGTFWSVSMVETDRDNRRISVQSARVPNLKFPDEVDANTLSYVKTSLEAGLPAVEKDLSQDVILTSIDANADQKKLSQDLSNKAPKIYYATSPSMLVLIDGEPKLKENKDWGVSAVVNTPFTIVKNSDGNFYLYGAKKWFKATSAKGPYAYTESTPANLTKVATAVDNQNNSDVGYRDSADVAQAQSDAVPEIIVSTVPAELIQTNGNPSFVEIQGTNLQYADNSQQDLFLDADTQQYYVLLSGRWYKTDKLNGSWSYVASNQLPADFAKIPEGSPKDNVLASVPGTSAAREAVMDAQIPQTAKVDRHSASTSVTYDGQPKFEAITGTDLTYAVNTQSSVLGYKGRYYSVDKGVWFVSDSPDGPWAVSTDRPDEVEQIPPSSPAYNLKYVYVYDATPDYVYMGYTPGYLNNYVYGGTVIYGTGYNYSPWWGNYYYARPYTWGFGVSYNPWWGWNLGFNYSFGWFNMGWGYGGYNNWGGWCGGWWGPSIYRPPYRYYGGYSHGGYYGPHYGGGYYGGGNRMGNFTGGRNAGGGRDGGRMGGRYAGQGMNGGRSINNIYNYRNDVVTNGGGRGAGGRDGGRVNNGGFNGGNNGGFNGGRGGARQDFNGNNGGNGFSNGINNSGMNGGRVAGGNPGGNTAGGGRAANGGANNGRVYTDGNGNVYQRGNQGQWQQRQQTQWQQVDNNRRETIQGLNRQQQQMNRGEQRTQNFQQYRNSAPSGGYSRPSGGNPGGGGGRTFSAPSGGGGRSFSAPSGGGGGRSSGGGGGGRGGRH
ncbi:hypothetical protein SAMN05421788_11074 [Filimonas lacunae]|uniref:Carbohydrate-binding family V/XII n=2 Tax=Filimonas lacunae TaxID=477680 RepID=A0A173M9Y6_9BACT|nr:RNA-binding region RNP-1 [Filimonas lacunae]SIT31089.1 hypothetical protein SAMN05421788_11074 [Filimonas lacunae]